MNRILAALATAAVVTLGFAMPAQAGGNSAPTPSVMSVTASSGSCGSTYTRVGHYPITASYQTIGYVDVYWSTTYNRNCLLTRHSSMTWGMNLWTGAVIRPSGYSWPRCPSSVGCDDGFYRYYAGPVFTPVGVDMTNRCIDVQGTIDWTTVTLTRIHCG